MLSITLSRVLAKVLIFAIAFTHALVLRVLIRRVLVLNVLPFIIEATHVCVILTFVIRALALHVYVHLCAIFILFVIPYVILVCALRVAKSWVIQFQL